MELVTKHSSLLGEGPVWDSRSNRILWIDILKGMIHQFFPHTHTYKATPVDQLISAIAMTENGSIIATSKSGFVSLDLETGVINSIVDVEKGIPDNRFNDGKCDPAGRFWAGTMSIFDTPKAGTLYVLDTDLSVSVKIKEVSCSNGLAWSVDKKTFYYIDSPTRDIAAYDYDMPSSTISNKRIIIRVPPSMGYPDGMTIDAEGMLWIAMWNGWKIVRYNPETGKQIYSFSLPVSQVSSCTFGGESLQDIYITSASIGLTKLDFKQQPFAGCLFVIKKSGFAGVETSRFLR
jgi:sugar lactone lactonase YvrE